MSFLSMAKSILSLLMARSSIPTLCHHVFFDVGGIEVYYLHIFHRLLSHVHLL